MAKNEIHFRNTDDCIKKIKSIRTMYRDTTPSYVALSDAIQALEEIQQCREYKEIFESHFSEEALKLLSNKEEFGKWLERGRWIAKKCDEINRELEQYRAIGTVEELKKIEESFNVISDKVWNYILAGEELLERYEAIGTIDKFKDLKEKNTKKRFNIFESHGMRQFVCGCCDRPILTTDNYCSFCGQKLDWQ